MSKWLKKGVFFALALMVLAGAALGPALSTAGAFDSAKPAVQLFAEGEQNGQQPPPPSAGGEEEEGSCRC